MAVSLRCGLVTIVRATLPDLPTQANRLIDLGVHRLMGWPANRLRAAAEPVGGQAPLLVVRPDLVAASALAPLVRHDDKPGFVVADMTDVDEFTSVAPLPDSPLYLIDDLDRGDDMANWSPDEAAPAIASAGRTALTLTEGLHWLLQCPDVLERGHCYMTIGSRKRKPTGTLDTRTPAIWISNGTGRDGADRRDAPKVGWCWAGNRHTWLGFASASTRTPVAQA